KSAAEMGHLTIKILNIEGRLLSTEDLEFEKQASLDVSGLSKGVYFLNIEEENGNTSIKKFIKK
ncbi:MAG: T9SS type A sorting domain-containing protein, partial [Aequorivita sp.]